MRTPEDWFENVWLPAPKDDLSIMQFILKVQQDAYVTGLKNAYDVLTKKDSSPNDPH